ncbi:hypothetical protein ACFFJB_06315 [Camelimonas abortus]|uniref:Lipoprotein n=1 Tax=Camelimonas abortus TaxID=1017184 RepID=A0ABV7LC53_9HYPH
MHRTVRSVSRPPVAAGWPRVALAASVAGLLLAGCSYNIGAIGLAGDRSAAVSAGSGGVTAIQSGPSGTQVYSAPPPGAAPARNLGPVLRADGACSEPFAGPVPAEIAPGIGECALVAAKGPPLDVLIGESGKGQREVQVLYQEPGGKRLYLFSDNRLLRVVD